MLGMRFDQIDHALSTGQLFTGVTRYGGKSRDMAETVTRYGGNCHAIWRKLSRDMAGTLDVLIRTGTGHRNSAVLPVLEDSHAGAVLASTMLLVAILAGVPCYYSY